jgi:L-ascorbate metabolism protein UlaG (beta-lactamase superfamily)
MTKHLDVTTLRNWLDQGKPVTVVGVRSADARTDWSIPGILKPGGRVQLGDIVIGEVLDDTALADIDLWTG